LKPIARENNNVEKDDSEPGTSVHLNVGAVHLQANDIDALRRLANDHPELATSLIDQKDRENRRENTSFIVGMITAAVLAITLIVVAGISLIYLGWWQALIFVASLLALSHVLRTILTGEWSDTSWFGKLTGAAPSGNPDEAQSDDPDMAS
jgi:hypothetical protein